MLGAKKKLRNSWNPRHSDHNSFGAFAEIQKA
jgi:hypothetical protein